MYIVKRRLNNNVVLVRDTKGKESIIFGRGIGFQVYQGDTIPTHKIQKKYVPQKSEINQLSAYIQNINEDILLLSQDVINHIEVKFDTQFSELLLFNLADHLNFSINNPDLESVDIFGGDLQLIYPQEVKMSKEAIDYILKTYNIELGKKEINFIAMHFINCNRDNSNKMDETTKVAAITIDILQQVEDEMGVHIDKDSTNFYRFLIHIKFFITRHLKGEIKSNYSYENYDALVKQFPMEYSVAKTISKNLQKEYDWKISSEEIVFLTIHLARVTGF